MFTKVAGLLLITGINLCLQAQEQCVATYIPEPCLPDCFNDPFGPRQSRLLSIGCCAVKITYQTRKACDQYYDVYLSDLSFCDSTNPTCSALTGLDPKALLAAVSEALLRDNPMNFPPLCGNSCEINWRVSTATCFAYCPGETLALHPCQGSACCLTSYTVCTDDCGNRTIVANGQHATGQCDGQIPYAGTECIPICN